MGVATVFVLAVLILLGRLEAAEKLQVGFYTNTCKVAESIVKQEVRNAYFQNTGIAPGIVRLHFHDCFVRGCDGSVLIDSTPRNSAEKDGPPNGISLRGLEVIDKAKSRIEAACKGVVSCADILAFAARDAVELTNGIGWDVPAGRRDGRISHAAETSDIPAPTSNLNQTTQHFAKKGLTQQEMVILQGAHTIGRSHCTSFSNRLYNFSRTISQDPSLNPLLANVLKLECPIGPRGTVNPNLVSAMNLTPDLFDNTYYEDVLLHNVVFTSDQTLDSSPYTLSLVHEFASNSPAWLVQFANAMVKMSKIGVLTGTKGEIRSNCRVINS